MDLLERIREKWIGQEVEIEEFFQVDSIADEDFREYIDNFNNGNEGDTTYYWTDSNNLIKNSLTSELVNARTLTFEFDREDNEYMTITAIY